LYGIDKNTVLFLCFEGVDCCLLSVWGTDDGTCWQITFNRVWTLLVSCTIRF